MDGGVDNITNDQQQTNIAALTISGGRTDGRGRLTWKCSKERRAREREKGLLCCVWANGAEQCGG